MITQKNTYKMKITYQSKSILWHGYYAIELRLKVPINVDLANL